MPSIGKVPPQTNSTGLQTHIRIRRQTECRNHAALIGIFNAVQHAWIDDTTIADLAITTVRHKPRRAISEPDRTGGDAR